MPKFGIRAAHTTSFAAHLGSETVPKCIKELPLAPTPSFDTSSACLTMPTQLSQAAAAQAFSSTVFKVCWFQAGEHAS